MSKMREQSRKHRSINLLLNVALASAFAMPFTLTNVTSATTFSTAHSRFIVNAKTVSKPLILTGTGLGGMDADVPLSSVIQTFKLMGIDNHWTRNVWSFKVPQKLASKQSGLHISGKGPVAIKINGHVSATIPGVVYRLADAKVSTTYVPINEVVGIARWLGVQSIWDGHYWINSYYTPKAINTGPANENRMSLNLTQQKTTAPSSAFPPSVPPIYGVTHLTLPLFPGSTSTSQKFSMAFEEVPISWYVRTGKAEYVATVDASHLEAWYLQHMQADGYQQSGSSTSGNIHTGGSSQGFGFQPKNQPRGHQIEVDISFENLGTGKTLFEYWATDLVIPPRPASNYLPSNVVGISGNMTVFGSKVTQYKIDITDLNQIKSLVKVANSLTKLIQGVNPGGPNIWGSAKLIFHTLNGQSIPVNINTDSASVNGIGLQDYQGTVWKTLEGIMGVSGPN